EGLRDLGYVDQRNIPIHFLSADGHYDRFPALATECVSFEPDIIVAYTTPGSLAVKKATRTIPIVTGPIGDPIGTGLVASLGRPGGNITGADGDGDWAQRQTSSVAQRGAAYALTAPHTVPAIPSPHRAAAARDRKGRRSDRVTSTESHRRYV